MRIIARTGVGGFFGFGVVGGFLGVGGSVG